MGMKRLFLLFTVCVFFSDIVYAYTCKIDGICYNLNKNNYTATVTYSGYPYNNDYTGHYGGDGLKDKDIVIPSTISYEDVEYTVTAIDDYAFWDAESKVLMSSVTIPSTVTSIGVLAFSKCENITSFTMPNSLTSIGSSAFSGCSRLSSIDIPSSVQSIGDFAFEGTAWYNSQPDGLVYAGRIAYKYKGTMPDNTSISIEEGTLSIAGYAFLNCEGLISVTIPSSVTSIGTSSFANCSNLVSMSVPNSIISVGYHAFNGTSWYNNLKDGLVYVGKVAYGYKGTMPDNTSIVVKEGTTEIVENAFKGCSGLVSVTIPNSVTSIGREAFYGCSGLTKVTLNNNNIVSNYSLASYYLKNTFYNQVQEFIIGDDVTSIGDNVFEGCSNMTSVTIPNSVTSIGNEAFKGCSGLTSVTIPNSVTSIGYSAFYGCSGLTSVTIPNSVASIDGWAFSGTRWYGNQPDGILYLDNWLLCFKGENPTGALVIPEGTRGVASYALRRCSGLTSVTIPNSVTTIGEDAFEACSSLASVTIPNSVTYIGEMAFYNCGKLMEVNVEWKIPISISKYVFSNRTNATLYVPAGCKAAYEAADYWKEFKEIVELSALTVADQTACRGGQVQLPVSMNNLEQIVGFQFDLQLPAGITVATDAHGNYVTSLTDRKDDHTLSVSKVGDNQYRFVSVSMNNKPFADNDDALVNVKLKVDKIVTIGSHTVTINGTELTTIGKEAINAANAVAMLTVKDAELGDVNGDMTISVTDVVAIISHILNDTPASFIESAADVNNDGRITVTDAVGVIDMILNKQ